MSGATFRILADAVLVTHAAFVAFVVIGLALILIGGARGWHWVRNPWLRVGHLAAIVVVVAQAWLGIACPLTALEMRLRARAGEAVYPGSFIAHWLEQALYYEAPEWAFALAYTVFAAIVAATWLRVRPRRWGPDR
jgi:polyferredoxin